MQRPGKACVCVGDAQTLSGAVLGGDPGASWLLGGWLVGWGTRWGSLEDLGSEVGLGGRWRWPAACAARWTQGGVSSWQQGVESGLG